MRLSPTLLLGVLALAACGGGRGGPPIDRAVAVKLAGRADTVAAAADPCTARDRALILQRQTIAAINAGRIPDEYLEPLQARVTEIASELEVRCLPSLTPRSTAPPPPAPATGADGGRHGHEQHGEKKHGHDTEHGRGHAHGRDGGR